jgi:uncharacterized protein (TIGR00251 family)
MNQLETFKNIIQSAREYFQKSGKNKKTDEYIYNLEVKVKPNSRKTKIEILDDGIWQISIQCPPVDGKANQALVEVLSQVFVQPKQNMILFKGELSCHKVFKIHIDSFKFNPEKMESKFIGLTA